MRRGRGAVLAAVVVLAGCGSSSPHRARRPAAPAAPAVSNGEAAKPLQRILADAGAAMRAAGSYTMRGYIVQGGARIRFALEFAGPDSLDFAFSEGARAAEVIRTQGVTYLRGNEALLRPQLGPRASLLAGRWFRVPPSIGDRVLPHLGRLAPSAFGRCFAEAHGTLTRAGKTTVGRRPAILIKDAGNVAGDGPGEAAIAASGPPYVLEITGTGPTRPGGRVDACNDGRGSNTTGVVTFSRIGDVPPIQPPSPVVNGAPGA